MLVMRGDFKVEIPNPKVLAVTCTRDGYANPSRRLPDKHIRLFHGRTLDEWYAIRCWASQYVTDWCIVGETEEHCDRIRPMMERYGGTVICRPPEFLHPIEDTGGMPMRYGMQEMVRMKGWYNCVVNNFVVNPVLPPNFFDRMVYEFIRQRETCEDSMGIAVLQPVYHPQEIFFEELPNGRLKGVGQRMTNSGKASNRWAAAGGATVTNIDMSLLIWNACLAGNWKFLSKSQGPMKMEVPKWTDKHIDTEDEWAEAEFWFGKKIGVGDAALEAYSEYREGWA